MPRCEGRPDGPCPDRKNDQTVLDTQGDVMLYPTMTSIVFRSDAVRLGRSKQHVGKDSTGSTGTYRQMAERQRQMWNRREPPTGDATKACLNLSSISCSWRMLVICLLPWQSAYQSSMISGVASYGALGHVPPRVPTVSFLVHFGVNLRANYPSIV